MGKNAFTLVEVVVTIVLIGIASLISIVAINRYMQNSYDQQLKIIRNTIATATDNYRISHTMRSNQPMSLSELVNGEVYLDNINYRKGVVCVIDSSSGTIELKGSSGTELNIKNENYCIRFYCNGELIINDYDSSSSNYGVCGG